MAKTVSIEPKSLADFEHALQKFTDQVRGDLDVIGAEQVRLMCRDAMTFTPPMPKGGGRGLSAAAHKAGMNKLGNDVRRIFVPVDEPLKGRPVFLRQIINAVKGNDTQTFFQLHQDVTESKIRGLSPVMRKIMEDSNWQRAQSKARNYLSKTNALYESRVVGVAKNLRPIHDQAKGAVGGRWPKGTKYRGDRYFADSTQTMNAYIEDRQRRVGRVKAGWAYAMRLVPKTLLKNGKERAYGAYNAPWVDANVRSAQGMFQHGRTKTRTIMTVSNFIGNINNVAKEAGTENIVYGNRVRQLNRTVESRLRDAVERANRKKQ